MNVAPAYYDASWWVDLARRLNEGFSTACPRVRGFASCTSPAYYEYIVSREGRAIVLKCRGCAELAHIVTANWSGSPIISANGSPKMVDVPRLSHLLQEMGAPSGSLDSQQDRGDRYPRGDRHLPPSPGRRVHVPGSPRRTSRRGSESPW